LRHSNKKLFEFENSLPPVLKTRSSGTFTGYWKLKGNYFDFLFIKKGAILLFEGTNMKLVKYYMEKMYIQKKRLFPPAPK
jgi:hypothetical protein